MIIINLAILTKTIKQELAEKLENYALFVNGLRADTQTYIIAYHRTNLHVVYVDITDTHVKVHTSDSKLKEHNIELRSPNLINAIVESFSKLDQLVK